jgi:Na+-translocating ferredoxin:NAD+ oxidoreductase RnfG subunit
MKNALRIVLLAAALWALPAGTHAGPPAVEEAVRRAFPDITGIDRKVVFLTDDQVKRIEQMAGVSLPSRLAVVYLIRQKDRVTVYALAETHIVRTKGETLVLFITPAGRIAGVEILAFHEPPEYRPTERWLAQFTGRSLTDDLRPRRGIHAVSGATLSAHAVTGSVRRLLAVWAVAVGGR